MNISIRQIIFFLSLVCFSFAENNKKSDFNFKRVYFSCHSGGGAIISTGAEFVIIEKISLSSFIGWSSSLGTPIVNHLFLTEKINFYLKKRKLYPYININYNLTTTYNLTGHSIGIGLGATYPLYKKLNIYAEIISYYNINGEFTIKPLFGFRI